MLKTPLLLAFLFQCNTLSKLHPAWIQSQFLSTQSQSIQSIIPACSFQLAIHRDTCSRFHDMLWAGVSTVYLNHTDTQGSPTLKPTIRNTHLLSNSVLDHLRGLQNTLAQSSNIKV